MRAAIAAAAVLVAAQLLPAAISNPPVTGDIGAPGGVGVALRAACYDCHSNLTRWPWYAQVAPLSWWIARDVEHGRRELNFSTWNTYYPVTRLRKLEWIGRSLAQPGMPPIWYRAMHPGARLTTAERAALSAWVAAQIAAAQSAR
ncbi:MAG TPA: heme-binding domain-containing protein [Candidatus Binataceae bacterium]|nr:heme-binding domain-containing protein [Candidatus Binataceae bacterium]